MLKALGAAEKGNLLNTKNGFTKYHLAAKGERQKGVDKKVTKN